MASGWYSQGLLKCLDGTIDIDTTALKIMLVKSTYTFDPDQALIDDGTANDLASHECDFTNYAPGFGGAGRKAATVTAQKSDANNRVEIALADLTWTAAGGASNNTIGGAALVREITNDGASIPIAFFDLTDTATNGGDIQLDFTALASGGNLRIAV